MVGQNANGFDSWVVLNSLVTQKNRYKLIKTARGLSSLSFRCGVKVVNTVELPQFVKLTCTKTHENGYLEKIGREYGLQSELLKVEIDRSMITKDHCISLKHSWEPYLKLKLLCFWLLCVLKILQKCRICVALLLKTI